MLKRILSKLSMLALIFVAGLVLAACQGPTPEAKGYSLTESAVSKTVSPTVAEQATATETEAAAVTEAAPVATQEQASVESAPPGCTVVTQSTPGPTEQALFPAPTEQDWTLGPEDAYVTIIEYGDFQ